MQYESEVLKYHTAAAHNREVFLLNHREEIECWDRIFAACAALRAALTKGRDTHNKTHVSFLPFVQLAQRQAMVGLDCLATAQTHACWPLLRPLIEATLFMGKWMDDPLNASVWLNQRTDRKSYNKTYAGQGLLSKSLPRSDAIQQALRRVNDDYEHMNERYCFRQAQATPLPGGYLLEVPMFDRDSAAHESHVYAATHLVLVLLTSISRMLVHMLVPVDTISVPLAQYEALRLPRVVELASGDHERQAVLLELGLWPL